MSALGSLGTGNETLPATKCCELNPGFTCRRFQNVRSNTPAPTKSINDNATSAPMSTWRTLLSCRDPELPRSRNPESDGSTFPAWNASTSPKSTVVSKESVRENASTRAST